MSEVLEKPVAEKRVVILNPQRLGLAGAMRQDWVVNVEEGTRPDDLLEPQYWSHCSVQFQQFDHLECRWENGERIVSLIVVETGRNWARMHMAGHIDFGAPIVLTGAAAKHEVQWKGPQRKHIVVRLSDQQAIQEGFATKLEAMAADKARGKPKGKSKKRGR